MGIPGMSYLCHMWDSRGHDRYIGLIGLTCEWYTWEFLAFPTCTYVPCGTVGQDRHTGSGLHGNPWDILTMSHVGHSYVGQWILLANLDMSALPST